MSVKYRAKTCRTYGEFATQTNNDEFVERMKCFRKKTSGETEYFRLGNTERKLVEPVTELVEVIRCGTSCHSDLFTNVFALLKIKMIVSRET